MIKRWEAVLRINVRMKSEKERSVRLTELETQGLQIDFRESPLKKAGWEFRFCSDLM